MEMAKKAFDPERYKGMPKDTALLEVWETAIQRPVKIEVESRAAYQRLKHKLYQLRLILRAEGHPIYDTIQHFTITSSKIGEDKFSLTISPGDEKISAALKRAGFLKNDLDDDFLNPEK